MCIFKDFSGRGTFFAGSLRKTTSHAEAPNDVCRIWAMVELGRFWKSMLGDETNSDWQMVDESCKADPTRRMLGAAIN